MLYIFFIVQHVQYFLKKHSDTWKLAEKRNYETGSLFSGVYFLLVGRLTGSFYKCNIKGNLWDFGRWCEQLSCWLQRAVMQMCSAYKPWKMKKENRKVKQSPNKWPKNHLPIDHHYKRHICWHAVNSYSLCHKYLNTEDLIYVHKKAISMRRKSDRLAENLFLANVLGEQFSLEWMGAILETWRSVNMIQKQVI